MKNKVIQAQKNGIDVVVKRAVFYLLLTGVCSTSMYATRNYISSTGPAQNPTGREQTVVHPPTDTTSPAVTADKLKALCDKIGMMSESAMQRYHETKNIKDELYKILKNNSQRDLIFKDGRIDCIALKGIVDSLNKDEITRTYQLLVQCEKLKEKKVHTIRNAVNEVRKAYGDTGELRSIENEIQVIGSSFIDFDHALKRLDAHEERMKNIRGTSQDHRKKERSVLGTVKRKAGSAVEKTKDFFVESEKTSPRQVQQDKYYHDKRTNVDVTVKSDDREGDVARYASDVLAQHEDIVEKTVEDARHDIEELSNEVVDLRKEAVDLYRQAIEKEVLAQHRAFEKADLLRKQAEHLSQEAEFLLRQADELEQRSREGV